MWNLWGLKCLFFFGEGQSLANYSDSGFELTSLRFPSVVVTTGAHEGDT